MSYSIEGVDVRLVSFVCALCFDQCFQTCQFLATLCVDHLIIGICSSSLMKRVLLYKLSFNANCNTYCHLFK